MSSNHPKMEALARSMVSELEQFMKMAEEAVAELNVGKMRDALRLSRLRSGRNELVKAEMDKMAEAFLVKLKQELEKKGLVVNEDKHYEVSLKGIPVFKFYDNRFSPHNLLLNATPQLEGRRQRIEGLDTTIRDIEIELNFLRRIKGNPLAMWSPGATKELADISWAEGKGVSLLSKIVHTVKYLSDTETDERVKKNILSKEQALVELRETRDNLVATIDEVKQHDENLEEVKVEAVKLLEPYNIF